MEHYSNIAISIIIPVYNSERWLSRCLDSVLAQEGFFRWEVILIDDGSTDKSFEICEKYVRENASISVHHIDNRGASIARRFGLEKATGEYVTFIDSDDYVAPNYLAKLFELETRFRIGVSACRVLRLSDRDPIPTSAITDFLDVLEGDRLFQRFFKYEFWGLYGKLYQKDLLLEIPFPMATLSEDYFVTARLLHSVGRMAYTDEALYFYEQHSGSLSQQAFSSRSFDEFINVNDVYEFVSAKMPKYRAFALSNAVETAVKILVASKQYEEDYVLQRQVLKTFLSDHRGEIMTCKPLNPKVRFWALVLPFSGRGV